GHYRPDPAEMTRLWVDGIVVLDTNALLNLYRYSTETSGEFLELLRSLGVRLWIPHQVGLEYHQNRLAVIAEQARSYEKLKKSVEQQRRTLVAEFEAVKRHPLIHADKLIAAVNEAADGLILSIERDRERHEEMGLGDLSNDSVMDSL